MKITKLSPTPTWSIYSTEWYAGNYYQFLNDLNETITIGEVTVHPRQDCYEAIYHGKEKSLVSQFSDVDFSSTTATNEATKEFVEDCYKKGMLSNSK